jgi:AraC-like DNA-binding protein
MRAAGSLDEYRVRPIGTYLSGPTFVVWWHSPQLNGISFWGRPEAQHVHTVTAALQSEFGTGLEEHASIVDARYMDGVDPAAFYAMSCYVVQNRKSMNRCYTSQAILRPSGLVGAVVAGFHAVLDTMYPVKVFTNVEPALEWLGARDAAQALDELDEIRAREIGTAPVVVALRRHLEQRPGTVTVDHVARVLGLSSRDLQRQLRAANTCFRTEQRAAQVRMAKTLLLETTYDLKRIAIEVGCSSGQRFSAFFRESVGVPPSRWRSHRPALFATSASRGEHVGARDEPYSPERRTRMRSRRIGRWVGWGRRRSRSRWGWRWARRAGPW